MNSDLITSLFCYSITSFIILFYFGTNASKQSIKCLFYAFSCEYTLTVFTMLKFQVPSFISLIYSSITILVCLIATAKKMLKDNGLLFNIVGIMILLETVVFCVIIISRDSLSILTTLFYNILLLLICTVVITLLKLINPDYKFLRLCSSSLFYIIGNLVLVSFITPTSDNLMNAFYTAIKSILSLPENLETEKNVIHLIVCIAFFIYNTILIPIIKDLLFTWWHTSWIKNAILK